MRNENGKFEQEKTLIYGSWHNLKADFKNRDFFQDLMIKLSNEYLTKDPKDDIPRYPISCLIDYCGFRALCEGDIYVDDGGLACRRLDHESKNNINDNYITREINNVIFYFIEDC